VFLKNYSFCLCEFYNLPLGYDEYYTSTHLLLLEETEKMKNPQGFFFQFYDLKNTLKISKISQIYTRKNPIYLALPSPSLPKRKERHKICQIKLIMG